MQLCTGKSHRLTGQALSLVDMLRIIKGRCVTAGLPDAICNHTFRGTGITVFLKNVGSLEAAQDRANHTEPRTTKLYDRRKDLATLSDSSDELRPEALGRRIWFRADGQNTNEIFQ